MFNRRTMLSDISNRYMTELSNQPEIAQKEIPTVEE